jgi:dihydroorotase
VNSITLIRTDDWQFARAIVMPNLKPPVTTVELARAYRERILAALAQTRAAAFEPLMTLYLTDNTSPDEIARARASGFVHAVKYYPAGATTNADSGVTALERAFPALAAMEKNDLPLLVHGEVTDADVDVFDREKVFIDTVLAEIVRRFPALRVVFEHITTKDAADYVLAAGPRIGATITAHHLLYNRNAIFAGGLRPHFYCLPVLKRERHRQALVRAATGGSPQFFLGTDSAPHPRDEKESACGCAGCFTAHAALELYAEAFDAAGALERLEAFASFNGPAFYRLPRNADRVTLVRERWEAPREVPFGATALVPLRGGEALGWRLV